MTDALLAMQHVRTPVLDIAYEEHAARAASEGVVVLLHGFPYDPRAFDAIAPVLAGRGYRVLVPYLRGYGETRFLSNETLRSGQQAALGKDLLDFLDALDIPQAVLAGYDWGGRAACIVAALWPQRVRGLLSVGGYNIQDIAGSVRPAPPEQEHRLWYQYYFHTPRGAAGLAQNRYAYCQLLWRLWSPTWSFDEATYARSAASFDNPDFVDVVIHSYRHRYAYVAGDSALESIEAQLQTQPPITVPAIVLHGADDGVTPPHWSTAQAKRFPSLRRQTLIPGVGHNLPQEAPSATIEALLELL
jgi:pimeloyl-ACP methyl ester carboxylesterase